MTLILAVVTSSIVALCAERRITVVGARDQVLSQTDLDGKCFVLGNHSLTGFTGLATIDGLKMEHWVANALQGVKRRDQITTLAERLTDARHRAHNRQDMIIGFRGVGFRRVSGQTVAQSWLLSNAINDDGEFDPRWADSKFEVRYTPVRYGETRLFALGEQVDPVVFSMAQNVIQQSAAAAPGSHKQIFENLDRLNTLTAQRSQNRVGEAVQLLALKRGTFERGLALSVGTNGRNAEQVMYEYRGHGARSTDPAAYHLPSTIDEGFSVSGGLFSMNPDTVKLPVGRAPKVVPPSAADSSG